MESYVERFTREKLERERKPVKKSGTRKKVREETQEKEETQNGRTEETRSERKGQATP